MSSRTLVLAFGFLFFAAALDAQLAWMPLDEAMKTAQASNRLILLDLRVDLPPDKKSDNWIAEAEKTPGTARVMDELALARQTWTDSLNALPDFAQFRGKRHLLVLDPWGGMVLEP